MRKMISFKVESLSPKEAIIIDTWADGQANIQQSLTNIVMHIVGFVGNEDVMDFHVQRKLHMLFANVEHTDTTKPTERYVEPIQQPVKQDNQDNQDVFKKAAELFKDED